jgi:hypothetical protein
MKKTILDYQNGIDSTPFELGRYVIRCFEHETIDWNYYSKAWHRAHGPKKTITDRRIEIYGKKSGKLLKRIDLNSWRGYYLLNAIAKEGIIKPVKVKKELKKVQLNKYFDVKKDRKIGNVAIYKRLFRGDIIPSFAIALSK